MAGPSWRNLNPITLTVQYLTRLTDNFGWRFILILLSSYVGVRGIAHRLVHSAYQPFMRVTAGVTNASEYQAFFTVMNLPWSLKASIGLISDVMPVAGYHKRYYVLGSAVLGSTACAVLAGVPIAKIGGGVTAAVLLFFLSLEVATVDLLVQGVYAKMMVAQPETGSDLVTAVWMFAMLGQLAASAFVGLFVDSGYPPIFFWVALPFVAQILVPVAVGWLPEERAPRGFRKEKVRENRAYFGLAILMTAGALGLGLASLWGSPVVQAVYAVSVSVTLCAATLWLLPRQIGKAQLYLFLMTASHLKLKGALDPFYTGSQECLPGGPSFETSFYLAWTAIIGAIFGLLGAALFQILLSRTWIRLAFWSTTVVSCVAAIVDIIIVKRWNLRIGIPDKVFFVIGDSMLQEVIEMMNVIPAVVLISKLCPPGIEATVYSLLAGYTNFGVAVASAMGSLAMDVAGIHTPGPGGGRCNFDRLPLLIAIGHVGLPLLVLPLTFWLIPNARMTDDLLVGRGLPSTNADDKDSGGSSATADDDKDGEVTPNSTDARDSSGGESPGGEGEGRAPTTVSTGSESGGCGKLGAEGPGGEEEATEPTMGAPVAAVGGDAPVPPMTVIVPTPLDAQDQ
ncbi:hypothetical protein MMPV_009251 [Pyropia vietnamensis]